MSTSNKTLAYSPQEEELLKEFLDEKSGEIIYPESDGEPMAENTRHFQWITTIQGGLDSLFANRKDVFVAGDLLWYPVEGKPYIRVAPDIFVAFKRPKGDRGSYLQWKENNIAPQVVFEILSKGNTASTMADKFVFYQKYGVQEYYVYDFLKNRFYASISKDGILQTEEIKKDFVSPLLRIRFNMSGEELCIFNPDGTPFLTYLEQDKQRQQALKEEQKAIEEEQKAIVEEQKAMKEKEEEQKAKEDALAEIERLKKLLQDKGVE